MVRRAARPAGRARPNCAGLSLVELMVAVVLGLLILAAMLSAYNSGSAISSTNARFAEVQTNGRYATDFLKREIQHAGFFGLNAGPQAQTGGPAGADYGCGAGFVARIDQPVWGSNDATTTPLSCIASTDFRPNTDVLVVRRAGLTPVTTTVANTLYVRTEFMQATVFVGGGSAPPNLQPPAEDFPLSVSVFYVSPYTKTVGDGVPALKRLRLGTGPSMTSSTAPVSPEVIASGIENMQVQYGVRDDTAVTFVDTPAATDWPNVVAVRLWLLARSSDAEYSGFANTKSYTMANHTGDNAIAVNDHYVREVFPLVVNLRR